MKREPIEIEKRLYGIWKDGFDTESLSQYEFNDDVVGLTEDVESLESYTSSLEQKLKIAEDALDRIKSTCYWFSGPLNYFIRLIAIKALSKMKEE